MPTKKPLLQLTVGLGSSSEPAKPGKLMERLKVDTDGPYVGTGRNAHVVRCRDTFKAPLMDDESNAGASVRKLVVKCVADAGTVQQEVAAMRACGASNNYALVPMLFSAFAVDDERKQKERWSALIMEELNEDICSRISRIKHEQRRDVFAQCVVQAAAQLCLALEHVHCKQIEHLDVKPENVLCVESDAHSAKVKLCDFGNALPHDVLHQLRGQGDIQTVAYRAPEVALGVGPVACASDSWSLGCTLAEMGMNMRLFASNSSNCDLLEQHASVLNGYPPSYAFTLPAPAAKAQFDVQTDRSREWRRRSRTSTFCSLRSSVGLQYAALVLQLLQHDPAQRSTPAATVRQEPLRNQLDAFIPPPSVSFHHQSLRPSHSELDDPRHSSNTPTGNCDYHFLQNEHHDRRCDASGTNRSFCIPDQLNSSSTTTAYLHPHTSACTVQFHNGPQTVSNKTQELPSVEQHHYKRHKRGLEDFATPEGALASKRKRTR